MILRQVTGQTNSENILLMKYLTMLSIAVVVGAMVLVTGCGAKWKVDTGKLTTGFASASAELKSQADAVVKAIKAKNLVEAVAVLEKMAEKTDLTAGQKQAMFDTLVDIQVVAQQNPPPNQDEMMQKIQDLQMKLM
jgi:hypothetical protein